MRMLSEMERPDPVAQRIRRCRKCGGDMRCKVLIQFRQNGGDAGRDYLFVCDGCKHNVSELSSSRVFLQGFSILCGTGLAVALVFFGMKMLLSTLARGFGGNDASAVIVVLALFLGLGLPFLGFMLWAGRSMIRDRQELAKNPIVR